MGGVATVRSYLRAGLVDELHLHVVPVLLGDGVPLFCAAEPIRRRLAVMSARAGRSATHVRYRVGAASGSTVTAPHG